jgi:hypothetical protein
MIMAVQLRDAATKRAQCVHIAKATGERCKRPPMKGQTECNKHGGTARNKRLGAQRRLLALVDPALAVLHKILYSKTATDADKLRAAKEVLDRTGYSAEQVLKIEPAEPDRWQQAMEGFLEGLETPSEVEKLPDADEDADDLPARSRRDRNGNGNGQRRDVSGGGDFGTEWSDSRPRSAAGMGETPAPPKYGKHPPQPPVRSRRVSR